MRRRRWRMVWKELRRLVLLSLGVFISALGYSLFQVPYDLAAGGVSGIAILVNHDSQVIPIIRLNLCMTPRTMVIASARPFVRPSRPALAMLVVLEIPSHCSELQSKIVI